MARRELKLKVTGQYAVGVTSILDRGQFSIIKKLDKLVRQTEVRVSVEGATTLRSFNKASTCGWTVFQYGSFSLKERRLNIFCTKTAI